MPTSTLLIVLLLVLGFVVVVVAVVAVLLLRNKDGDPDAQRAWDLLEHNPARLCLSSTASPVRPRGSPASRPNGRPRRRRWARPSARFVWESSIRPP